MQASLRRRAVKMSVEKAVGEKTFSLQETLPSLPVPGLEETLRRYVASVRPLVSAEELAETKRRVAELLGGEGPRVQEALERKASRSRNWLTTLWEDEAYLKLRFPLAPFVNFGGSSQNFQAWPPTPGTQVPYSMPFLVVLDFIIISPQSNVQDTRQRTFTNHPDLTAFVGMYRDKEV